MSENDVAKTILAQLGGGRFLAMTGAVLLADARSLTIKLGRGSSLSCLVVALEAGADTYSIQSYRGRGLHMRAHGEPLIGAHAEDLRGIVEGLTGFRTSL